jgi:hypothetical protein
MSKPGKLENERLSYINPWDNKLSSEQRANLEKKFPALMQSSSLKAHIPPSANKATQYSENTFLLI